MNLRALTGSEKVLGLEHPDTLTGVDNLAHLLHSQQQFQQASVLHQRALSSYQQTLGLAHPKTWPAAAATRQCCRRWRTEIGDDMTDEVVITSFKCLRQSDRAAADSLCSGFWWQRTSLYRVP
jgi:hypothetical protein